MTALIGDALRLRSFEAGDAAVLWAVLHASVHGLTRADYSAEQRAAWAPEQPPRDWDRQIALAQAVVAELDGVPVGFSDLQADGYVTFFYVSGNAAGQGIGTCLMHELFERARNQCLSSLTSDVSRTAQPFFERFGWSVLRQQRLRRAGVVLHNARMIKKFELPAGGCMQRSPCLLPRRR